MHAKCILQIQRWWWQLIQTQPHWQLQRLWLQVRRWKKKSVLQIVPTFFVFCLAHIHFFLIDSTPTTDVTMTTPTISPATLFTSKCSKKLLEWIRLCSVILSLSYWFEVLVWWTCYFIIFILDITESTTETTTATPTTKSTTIVTAKNGRKLHNSQNGYCVVFPWKIIFLYRQTNQQVDR